MGAAVPIIGGVVGVAGTISGISQQERQARQQQEALLAQEQAASRNMDLRLQEIEQQRLYAQYQQQIEAVARANTAAYQQQEDQITRQQINFANQQQQFMSQMQLMQQQGQIDDQQAMGRLNFDTQRRTSSFNEQTQRAANNINRDIGEGRLSFNQAGRNLQQTGQDMQTDLGRRQLMGQQGLQRAGEGMQFETALQREQLAFQQNLRGLVDQYDNARIGANAADIQAENQALQGSRELNRMAQEGTRELRGAEQATANNLQALSQRGDTAGISDSARLLADTEMNEAQQNAIERRMLLNEGQSELNANLELSRGLSNFSRIDASRQLIEGARGLASTREINRNALDNQRLLSEFGRTEQTQNFENTADVNRYLSSMGNNLASRQERFSLDQQSRLADFQLRRGSQLNDINLGQQRQAMGIQNAALDRSRSMSQQEYEYAVLQAALDAGMENQALDILQQARANTNALENQAAQLNNTMSDIAFSQNAFSTINTGRSEINALAAQRNNVQSPGFLSYASAGIQAASSLNSIFNQPRNMVQQPQPQYSFATNGTQFNQANPNSFLGGF